jgi:hypothetical protein
VTTARPCGTTSATAADCPEIDTYRQELHDLAVETGAPTAEPEGPRGVEEFEREHRVDVEQGGDPVAPAVQATCPATFGKQRHLRDRDR